MLCNATSKNIFLKSSAFTIILQILVLEQITYPDPFLPSLLVERTAQNLPQLLCDRQVMHTNLGEKIRAQKYDDGTLHTSSYLLRENPSVCLIKSYHPSSQTRPLPRERDLHLHITSSKETADSPRHDLTRNKQLFFNLGHAVDFASTEPRSLRQDRTGQQATSTTLITTLSIYVVCGLPAACRQLLSAPSRN